MRIGILTFHNTINYGGVLQCYALKEFLSSRGHDVDIIDYRTEAVEEYKKILIGRVWRNQRSFRSKASYLLSCIRIYNRKRHAVREFDKFLSFKLNFSHRVYNIDDMPRNYDFFFFGSDQIWNPYLCHGFDPVYWGQFYKGNTKFITYAVSLGEPRDLIEEEWHKVGEYIKVFDSISVRERNLKIELERRFPVKVKCTLDPTLLCDADLFDKIAICPSEDNYIFLFNIQKDDKAISFACRIASIIGCKVIVGQARPKLKQTRRDQCTIVEAFSPEKFVGYIKKARIVVGNSFHVIAISLALKKTFYSLDSPKSGRIESLLDQLGLMDRHVSSSDQIININEIDYSQVHDKLFELKHKSIQFIENVGC